MTESRSSVILLLFLLASMVICHKMSHLKPTNLLEPQVLQHQMFKEEISGKPNVLTPTKVNRNKYGQITGQEYVIDMVKTKQQILPQKLFQKTTIYAYGGFTSKGYYAGFPGPAILATKDRSIKVTYRNKIPGPHILPVDYSYPFIDDSAFRYEVPTVPHAHGLAVNTSSDGGPDAYWTITGQRGMSYSTQEPCPKNSAVYIYPNEQDAGNFWFHDHAYGITRLNVYAGLVGLYKIIDPSSKKQKQIVSQYGIAQNQTKFIVVTDKSFTTDGQLYYAGESSNPSFKSWVPQFFGNTILVNGVLWPKMNLKQTKHRFVFLNACQGRFLNIWFENKGQKIPFELIRVDGNFYDKPVIVTELLTTISSRVEFILDLSKVKGQIILRNNAPSPFPAGDQQNYSEQFTGQIMKIIVKPNSQQIKHYSPYQKESQTMIENIQCSKSQYKHTPQKYPKFAEGQKIYMTLFEAQNEEGDVEAAFINGISMMNSMECPNSTYRVGKTYDFYFINLTPDTHPIHFHLVNMQKVKQFKFDDEAYSKKYFQINGGKPGKQGWDQAPISLDPEEFRTGKDEFPTEQERIFRDTMNVDAEYVTVMRVKFAKNDGTLMKSFDMRGQQYVLHCHILQHEDNTMMINYCLQ